MAREDVGRVYSDTGDFQAAYDPRDASVDEAFANWYAEIAHARRIEASIEDLTTRGRQQSWGEDVTLRWVLVHMVEEYARHNGHADFLREAIDGTIGE